MKKIIFFLAFAALLLQTACQVGSSVSSAGNETVSEVALASASGAIASTEGESGRYAERSTTCPTLSSALADGDCQPSTGQLTLNYYSCQFETPSNTLYAGIWTGGQELVFSTSSGTHSCPTDVQQIPVGNFVIARTFLPSTARTGANGITVTADTSTWGGWDTTPANEPAMGEVISYYTAGGGTGTRTVVLNGVHHVASLQGSSTSLWDHSISTAIEGGAALNVQGTGGYANTANGTVIVEHNKIKATFQAVFTNVTYNTQSCGCFPTGGTITTTCINDATSGTTCKAYGTETLTINSPGTGGCATNFTISGTGRVTGAEGTRTFAHCF